MPRTLVFDLDGTLVDTAPDLTRALNHVLRGAGRPEVPAADVRHMVGRGARVLIERGLAASGAGPTPDELERLFDQFLEFYGRNLIGGSRPYDGVEAFLTRHGAAGARLAVCTNKPHAMTAPLLDALDLSRHFHAMVGAGAIPERKPDPAHLFEAIARAGGEAGNAVMIGDSETDLLTARAAGTPCFLVSFGYTPVPARALGADAVIDHFDELDAALAALA